VGKKVELIMDCPRCKATFKAMLYRTIWVEYPEDMELIMTDTINVAHCSACGLSERQPFPFLATNVRKNVAIWYEPIPDRNIDLDVELYRKHYGEDYFLARAPRIKDWTEFKAYLIELNKAPDIPHTVGDLARLKKRMQSAFAKATKPQRVSKSSNLIASLRIWAGKLRRACTPLRVRLSVRTKIASERLSSPVSPITKLEQAVSTWDRGQARIALAVFAVTIFEDRTALEFLFGKDANVETAIRRLTVSHLKVLHSIMAEIVPDDGSGDRAGRQSANTLKETL